MNRLQASPDEADIRTVIQTLTISREQRLELENLSLKAHIARLNWMQLDQALKAAAQTLFDAAGLSSEEYSLDVDKGAFVKK